MTNFDFCTCAKFKFFVENSTTEGYAQKFQVLKLRFIIFKKSNGGRKGKIVMGNEIWPHYPTFS